MDIRTKRTLFQVGSIIALIEGIILCVSLCGAILGIFLIIASNKFKELMNYSDRDLAEAVETKRYFGWSIFLLIVSFYSGVFTLLPYLFFEERKNTRNNDIEY